MISCQTIDKLKLKSCSFHTIEKSKKWAKAIDIFPRNCTICFTLSNSSDVNPNKLISDLATYKVFSAGGSAAHLLEGQPPPVISSK